MQEETYVPKRVCTNCGADLKLIKTKNNLSIQQSLRAEHIIREYECSYCGSQYRIEDLGVTEHGLKISRKIMEKSRKERRKKIVVACIVLVVTAVIIAVLFAAVKLEMAKY